MSHYSKVCMREIKVLYREIIVQDTLLLSIRNVQNSTYKNTHHMICEYSNFFIFMVLLQERLFSQTPHRIQTL